MTHFLIIYLTILLIWVLGNTANVFLTLVLVTKRCEMLQ